MTNFQDIFSCSVCLDIYKTPKRLPFCQHVYCKSCIDGLAAQYGGQRLICPDCRTDQQLPAKTENLIDDLKLKEVMSHFRCADCEEIHSETSPCNECKSNTCKGCKTNHKSGIVCDILSRLRWIRIHQPEQETSLRLQNVAVQWTQLQTQLTEQKKQVKKSIETIHKVLKREKGRMLEGINNLNAMAEGRLSAIHQIAAAPDFAANTKATIEQFGGDEAVRVLIESKVHEEALKAMEKILTEAPPQLADMSVTEVAKAVEKMGEQFTEYANKEAEIVDDSGEAKQLQVEVPPVDNDDDALLVQIPFDLPRPIPFDL